MLKAYKTYFHAAIMIILTFAIGHIPPLGGDITPLGMKVLGVFVGLLYGWCFVDFFWTSCFGFLALGLTGYISVAGAIASGFSAQITVMLIFLFAFVGYLIQSGFVEMVTGWFLTRKICYGRPWVLFFMVLLSAGVLGILGLAFGAIFLTWAILYKMFDLVGHKKGDWIVSFLIYGVVILCSISNAVFPFSPMPLLFTPWLASVGVELPDIAWMIYEFSFFFIYLLFMIVVGKYILKIDVSKFIEHADEVAAVYSGRKITSEQKIASVMVILFLLITLLPSLLPETFALKAYLAQYGLMGAVIVIMAITSVIRIKDKPITDWARNTEKGMNWNMLMMMAVTTPVANAIESADSGILSTIIGNVTPLLANMSPVVYTFLALMIILLLTQVAHNVVVIIALSPTILNIATTLGANPAFLAAAICIMGQTAFLTPAASSASAAVHSNTDWMDVKHAYIFGAIAVALGFFTVVVTYPIGNFLF